MSRLSKILLSIPKTIWFNLRYIPFSQAIKLPIWVASNVRIKSLARGCIILNDNNIRTGLIRIGYHEADAVDSYGCHTILNIDKNGTLVIEDDVHIGHGAIINIKNKAKLVVGRNFAISGTTAIICNKSISIGSDVQLSWNSLITDSDAHTIYSIDSVISNHPKEISIGNKVWIAANTTILKGTKICDNTVVASNSLLNKEFHEGNCIIAGSPAKVVKRIGGFKI
jgi:acetyltransferase-like isoleucine patch superfamily enzyme